MPNTTYTRMYMQPPPHAYARVRVELCLVCARAPYTTDLSRYLQRSRRNRAPPVFVTHTMASARGERGSVRLGVRGLLTHGHR